MVVAPKVKLNNGVEIPVLGLGTYASTDNEGELAIKHAIDCGYRHIDTAYFYQNEKEIGKVIQDKINEGVIKREDVFITTKLWNIHHSPDKVEHACRKSLSNLGLDYIDLYLMHLPVGYAYVDDDTLMPKNDEGKLMLTDVDYVDTWKSMENLVKLGLVKSLGVSNFNSEQCERLLKNCEIKPVVNQVECHLALNQRKLIKFCKDRDIIIVAYCPLAHPKPAEKKPEFLYSDKMQALAKKYNKTPAQMALRYLVECHPALNQKKLIKFCKDRDILITAYCPLARPKPEEKKPEFMFSDKMQALAKKYNKTPAQIALRYLIDIGTIPIPKSSNFKRIEENFNVFDFKLSDEDIAEMDTFNTGERCVPFLLIKGQNHKYFPFNIEF